MSLVLIADEDPVPRAMAAALLRDVPGLSVIEAGNAAEAIDSIAIAAPDVVLAGLDAGASAPFIKRVRELHPRMPMILLVTPGHESVAVEGLRLGAATFVPRSRLARDLVCTLNEVLRLVGVEQGHRRILDCFSSSITEFSLENDPALAEPLIGFLLESLARIGMCDESRRIRVGIALQEALSNAMIHGNLEVSSVLRDNGDAPYHNLVKERRQLKPWSDRRVYVTARESREQAVYVIRDEGPGFEVAAVSDPLDMANLERPSGRGLLLIRTFMDEVQFNDRGNEIIMTLLRKRCPVQWDR